MTAGAGTDPGAGLRILYVGQLGEGGTCLDRMRTLQDLAVAIVPFDVAAFESPSRIVRSFSQRTNSGPTVSRVNRALRARGAALGRTIDCIFVDKGSWILPETLADLREKTGARLLHFTPDPAFLFNRSRHFIGSIPLYDLLVTTKPWEVDLYRAHGARKVFLTRQAYERSRFFPMPPSPALASDVTFVGRCEPAYAAALKAAGRLGITVRIWGRTWARYARMHRWAIPHVQGAGIWGADYTRAICSAAICLGLLSKLVPETSTTRTFEIPACGGFLLAERTEEHQSFFTEGEEAEFFASLDEMRDKIRYYLSHPQARSRIAAGGRLRCLRSGYSNHDTLGALLRDIKAVIA